MSGLLPLPDLLQSKAYSGSHVKKKKEEKQEPAQRLINYIKMASSGGKLGGSAVRQLHAYLVAYRRLLALFLPAVLLAVVLNTPI